MIHNKKKPYILLEEILEYYHRETFDEKKIDYYLHFLVNVNLELFKAYFFIHLENQRFQFLVDKIIPIGLKFSDKETINEFQYWMGILQFNLKNYSLSQEYFLKSYLSYTSYYSFKSFLYMKEFYKENYFKISPEEVKSLRDKKRSEFLRSNLFIKRYQETYPFLFKKENFLKLKVYPHLLRLMYFSYFDIASEEEKKEYKFFTNESCENQAHLYRSLVYYFYSIAHYQYGINFSNKLVYCFNKNLYGFYIPAELYMFSYPILFESMLKDLEKEYKVNLFLILSIMRRESRFMQELKSTSSAIGVMQIIPSTGKYIREKLNLKNLFIENKIDNIKMGVHYFSFLKDKFDGLNIFALASYNAGPGRIQFWMKKAEKNIPFILNMEHFIDRVILAKETRLYIKSIYLYYYNYLRIYNQEIN